MTERRRILLVALVLAVLGTVMVCRAQAHPVAVRWTQPDYQPGDAWEIRWIVCSVDTEWQPLISVWGSESAWGGVQAPQVDCAAVARTWRDGEVSVDSAPRVYVPEPPRWALLAAGVGGLVAISRRVQ